MSNYDQMWQRALGLLLIAAALAGCTALTPAEEEALAVEQIEAINRELDVLEDPAVQSYLDALAASLLGSGTSPDPVRIHVVRNGAFNAFAIAGGHVYITTGVILGSRNAAELTSILAHEMAHIERRHVGENYRRFRTTQTAAEISGILLALLTGNPFVAGAGDLAANLGSSVFITAHTREAEREADALAFEMMLAAGFDPRSQLTLLSRLLAASLEENAPAPFLATHPLPVDRVDATRLRLHQISDFTGLRVGDDGALEAIQQSLAR